MVWTQVSFVDGGGRILGSAKSPARCEQGLERSRCNQKTSTLVTPTTLSCGGAARGDVWKQQAGANPVVCAHLTRLSHKNRDGVIAHICLQLWESHPALARNAAPDTPRPPGAASGADVRMGAA